MRDVPGIFSGQNDGQKPPPGCSIDEGHPLAPNAVAMLFNERGSTRINDILGHAGTYTFTGNSGWTTGRSGSALRFMATTPTSVLKFPGITFGTTSWLAVDVRPNNGFNIYQAIVADQAGNVGLYLKADTKKFSIVYGSADHLSNTVTSNGVWYQVIVSIKAGSISLYVNGTLDSTFASFPGFTAVQMGDDGGDKAQLDVGYFYGANGRSLRADQAQQLFKRPFAPFTAANEPATYAALPLAASGAGLPKKWFPGMSRRWLARHRPGR